MAMDLIHGSDTLSTEQAVISRLVQMELQDQAVLSRAVRDVSAFAEQGAKSVEFPRAGNFQVRKLQKEEKSQTQKLTYATDKMDLSEHAVVDYLIPKRASMQSRVALRQDAISRAASAHAAQVDFDLLTEMEAANQASEDVVLGSALALSDIAEARRKILNKKYPGSDIWMVLSPDLEEELISISNFNNADSYGNREGLVEGTVGRVYGVNVLVSTQVEDVTGVARTGFMFHRDSIALAFQQAPDVVTMYDQDYLGDRTTVDQLYGIKSLQRGDVSGAASGDDTGIIKLRAS
jgi:N4-gp56 family major capsid protein